MILPKKQSAASMQGFRLLSEYECGRAQMAIEWVARGQKPVAEIGGRPLAGCDLRALACDLGRCVARSGESVRAFVIPDGVSGYCCYGFYRYPWAIDALRFAWGSRQRRSDLRQSLWWIQGLVFGYSPAAIQRFSSSVSGARGSSPHSRQRIEGRPVYRRLGRVEIYDCRAWIARRHSSLNGRRRRRG
jgi:hypothetical protein